MESGRPTKDKDLLAKTYKLGNMETTTSNDPKDEHITNKDDSVTNKDGDNYLEKGKLPTDQDKPDPELVPTVTPDNENGEPGPPAGDKDSKDPEKEQERLKHTM